MPPAARSARPRRPPATRPRRKLDVQDCERTGRGLRRMRSKFGGWWVASALAAPIVLAQGDAQEAGDSPESIEEDVRSHAAGLVRTHARREALIAEERLPRTAPFFVVRAGGADAQRPL